jgi:hypothetical protein
MEQSLKLSSEDRWLELGTIRTFDGTKNAILIMAISCPSGAGAVFAYVDYVELYARSEVVKTRRLNHNQWADLQHQLPNLEWHSL